MGVGVGSKSYFGCVVKGENRSGQRVCVMKLKAAAF